jgi:hypothetical protein
VFPILGSALVLIGFILLTRLGTGSSLGVTSAYLVVIGIGMGVMYQVYVIASQNAVDPSQIGVTTGLLNFFRSMGGSFAVAGLGALLTSRLGTELAQHLGRAGSRIDPNQVVQSGGGGHLPPSLAEGIQAALSASLHTVFVACVPIAAIGLALALALPERPLRRQRVPAATPTPARAGG